MKWPHAHFNLAAPKAGTARDTQMLYRIALGDKITLNTKSCSLFMSKEELAWLLVHEGESSRQSTQKEIPGGRNPLCKGMAVGVEGTSDTCVCAGGGR